MNDLARAQYAYGSEKQSMYYQELLPRKKKESQNCDHLEDSHMNGYYSILSGRSAEPKTGVPNKRFDYLAALATGENDNMSLLWDCEVQVCVDIHSPNKVIFMESSCFLIYKFVTARRRLSLDHRASDPLALERKCWCNLRTVSTSLKSTWGTATKMRLLMLS